MNKEQSKGFIVGVIVLVAIAGIIKLIEIL